MESRQAMTIDDIDIYRVAKLLIEKHDDDAATIATKRATELLVHRHRRMIHPVRLQDVENICKFLIPLNLPTESVH